MLQDVDASVRALLESSFADEKIDVVFEPPTPAWAAEQQHPVLDLFLYDVRELHDGRQSEPDDVRDDDGRVIGRQSPARRYRLSYLVSAWGGGSEHEHRILGRVLDAVPEHDIVPIRFLEGRLVEQGLPLLLRIAGVAEKGNQALWSALGTSPRTALQLDVVAPLLPQMSTGLEAAAERMHLGVTKERPLDGRGDGAGSQRPVPPGGPGGRGEPGAGPPAADAKGGRLAPTGRVVKRWTGVDVIEHTGVRGGEGDAP